MTNQDSLQDVQSAPRWEFGSSPALTFVSNAKVRANGELNQFSQNYMQAVPLRPISRSKILRVGMSTRAVCMDSSFILTQRVCPLDASQGAAARSSKAPNQRRGTFNWNDSKVGETLPTLTFLLSRWEESVRNLKLWILMLIRFKTWTSR